MSVSLLSAPAVDTTALLEAARRSAAEEAWPSVAETAELALRADPSLAEAAFLAALAAYLRQDFAAAKEHGERAVEIDSTVRDYADFVAVLMAIAGDLTTSTYYAKIAHTGAPHPEIAALMPKQFPTLAWAFENVSDRPFLRRAVGAWVAKDWTDAETWFHQHLAFHPGDATAHHGLAMVLLGQGHQRAAVEALRGARHTLPHDVRIASQLGNALAGVGEFAQAHACHRAAVRLSPDDPVTHAAALLDRLQDPDQDADRLTADFAAWGRRFGIRHDEGATPPKAGPRERLRVGYMFGAQGATPFGAAISAILAHHDPRRFAVIGFGFGPLQDQINLVFQKCAERWQDVTAADPLTFAAMVAAEDVDVLIDVSGFASPGHLVAFGRRMAPCQAAWCGRMPGTGLAAMDYLIGDAVLDPADDRAASGERIVRLELGAVPVLPMVVSDQVPAPKTDPNLLFAADAGLMELHPRSIEAWAAALVALPGATLLLRDQSLKQPDTVSRLIGLFGNFGVAHRIDIVEEPLPSRFFATADIALMPVPGVRTQTMVEAFWAGVPTLCVAGNGRAMREAASLLHHLGLASDMLATDADGLAALARAWCEDAETRNAFRAGARQRVFGRPSCDPVARARDLERAIEAMWRETCDRG